MNARAGLDVARCEELIDSLVRGAREAWSPLASALCPALLGYAERSRALGHRRSEDDCQEVLTAVLERLSRNDFRALKLYGAWRLRPENAAKTLEDYLRIIIGNVARDYVSRRARRSVLNTLAAVLETDAPPRVSWPGMTDIQAVRELVEHAERALPPDQASAVKSFVGGRSAEEIAGETGEAEAVVVKRLRAAFARLRRWAGRDAEEDPAGA